MTTTTLCRCEACQAGFIVSTATLDRLGDKRSAEIARAAALAHAESCPGQPKE